MFQSHCYNLRLFFSVYFPPTKCENKKLGYCMNVLLFLKHNLFNIKWMQLKEPRKEYCLEDDGTFDYENVRSDQDSVDQIESQGWNPKTHATHIINTYVQPF